MDTSGKIQALKTYLTRLKDRTEILQNTFVPSEFKNGHEILLNGSNLAIAALEQILASLEYGYELQGELADAITDKFKRADLLINQGQKELKSTLTLLKAKE